MIQFFSGLLLFAFCSVCVFSQTGGQSVSKTITDSDNGFSFVLPEKWESQKSDDGYLLGNEPRNANIVIKPHSYASFEEFVRAEVDLARDGLTQVGDIVDLGEGMRMVRTYKPNGATNLIVDTFFVPAKVSVGVLVVALSTDNAVADTTYQTAAKIVKTFRFTARSQTAQSSQYQNRFAGKKLSFFYTGNGYSERRTVWLCRSGSFISKSESSSISALGSGATSSGDQGNWRVQTSGANVVLVLDSTRGNGRRSFTVTARQASNEVALNGERYFVETHNECN